MKRTSTRRVGAVRAVVVTAVLAVAGCSDDDGGGGEVASESPVTTAVAGDGDVFREEDAEGEPPVTGAPGATPSPPEVLATAPLPPDESGVSDSVLDPIEPVSDTGVPGIDSDDEFCRAWSEFLGSFQALSFAWVVLPDVAPGLEVAAADVLIDAAAALDVALPDELSAERETVAVDMPGPLVRRAERARQTLVAAGLDDDGIDAVGDAWLEALAAWDPASDTFDFEPPPGAADALDVAGDAFAAELPPLVQDPSLVNEDLDLSVALEYVAATCPDGGTLAGNDVVS